tara:strand:- start:65 stop:544 length:480 start_codon:yes stop_codon:yes gene_type:complete
MTIYKNFLSKEIFKKLKDAMMSDYFPWYFNDGIDYKGKKDNSFQFTYTFVAETKINCSEEMIDIIKPILKKIKYKKLNRVKANLLTRTHKIIESQYHIDQKEGTTGIFYLNKCNGYTIFENGKKISSEENKYVEFNSNLKHTGSSCTDEQRRVVINFNY